MADRKTWGNRLLVGGVVAVGLGLILRLSYTFNWGSRAPGDEEYPTAAGAPKTACKRVVLRSSGLFLNCPSGTDCSSVPEVTATDLINRCASIDLLVTGGANWTRSQALIDAIEAAGIPLTTSFPPSS